MLKLQDLKEKRFGKRMSPFPTTMNAKFGHCNDRVPLEHSISYWEYLPISLSDFDIEQLYKIRATFIFNGCYINHMTCYNLNWLIHSPSKCLVLFTDQKSTKHFEGECNQVINVLFCLFFCFTSYPEKLEVYIPTSNKIWYILEELYPTEM